MCLFKSGCLSNNRKIKIYFVSVLLGNLISTVFEALQLNSVVNLMGLPMSLIISVIASTIIFRHVFTHHESHHSGPGPSDPAAMSPSRVTPPSVSARLERQGRLGHSECLALKEITRSYGEGPIKVTKTVDIEHDGPKADVSTFFQNSQNPDPSLFDFYAHQFSGFMGL